MMLTTADRWIMQDRFRQFMLRRASASIHVVFLCILIRLRPSAISGLERLISADSTSGVPLYGGIWAGVWRKLEPFFQGQPKRLMMTWRANELSPRPQPLEQSPWVPSAELVTSMAHWSGLSVEGPHKALWVTAENDGRRHEIAQASYRQFCLHGGFNTALVDVSQTRSIFWPLALALAKASPGYMEQLEEHPPWILRFTQRWYFSGGLVRWPNLKLSPWAEYDDLKDISVKIFVRPVTRLYNALDECAEKNRHRIFRVETGHTAPDMPRTTLILYGVHDTAQADEIWSVVTELKDALEDRFKAFGIVIVSEPSLLRPEAEDSKFTRVYFETMHVSDTGLILYSGTRPTPPMLCENLFSVWVDAIHRIGGNQAESMWPEVLSYSGDRSAGVDEESYKKTTAIFSKLFKAAEDRKQILKVVSTFFPHNG
ncbi:hypothetical protein DFH08DRAFT_348440 [Mycena albidolilacea]|uniref:Uncharacterized protein n=1 Tax=Mycena albidolilacea TaxID=1033008 RepID=A0AAD6ZHX6_9AGAR|nr:hypothetical protein DFH08DRAFT_348440 [Mycena albidolilacea]